jgi:hypothetical protein
MPESKIRAEARCPSFRDNEDFVLMERFASQFTSSLASSTQLIDGERFFLCAVIGTAAAALIPSHDGECF